MARFVSMCAGSGWQDPPRVAYNTRLFTIGGGPDSAAFAELPGFPDLVYDAARPETTNGYFGFGTLAIDERMYLFLSTPNHRSWSGVSGEARFIGAKLIYSPDNGRTWCPGAVGPWTQFYEESAWTPEGDSAARAYQPQISPKWIAQDGRSFWLVWTDIQIEEEELATALQISDPIAQIERTRTLVPYYGFNLQRVDLTI